MPRLDGANPGWVATMESNRRYFARRSSDELRAAARAVTSEARDRRLQLAERYRQQLEALG